MVAPDEIQPVIPHRGIMKRTKKFILRDQTVVNREAHVAGLVIKETVNPLIQ